MDYKKIYQSATKHLIPKDFEIHHIDFNRENNKIENLVMLPESLHRALHNSKNEIEIIGIEKLLKVRNDYTGFSCFKLKNYLEIIEKCNAFVRLRDCLINGDNYIGGKEAFMESNNVLTLYNNIFPTNIHNKNEIAL